MSTLKQVGHLVRLLDQCGIEGDQVAWNALFQNGLLPLLLRATVNNPKFVLTINRGDFRTILGFPREEFEVFCPEKKLWDTAVKIFGTIANCDLEDDINRIGDMEPRGKFKGGELIELKQGVRPSEATRSACTGTTPATLSQLICFCVEQRQYLKHQADLVGTGSTFTVMCGVKTQEHSDSVFGIRITSGYRFSLEPVGFYRVASPAPSRTVMLVFPEPLKEA